MVKDGSRLCISKSSAVKHYQRTDSPESRLEGNGLEVFTLFWSNLLKAFKIQNNLTIRQYYMQEYFWAVILKFKISVLKFTCKKMWWKLKFRHQNQLEKVQSFLLTDNNLLQIKTRLSSGIGSSDILLDQKRPFATRPYLILAVWQSFMSIRLNINLWIL